MKSSPERDLESIRQMMERSSKFMSLSGISGILSGIYALSGAVIGYYMLYYPRSPFGEFRLYYLSDSRLVWNLGMVAVAVLVLSLVTGYWFSARNARRNGVSIWNPASKKLLVDLSIPLVTGGLVILIFVAHRIFGVVGPACLLFYGLALVNGSQRTFREIKFLGICEIVLGLIGTAYPGYSLIMWAVGFGLLHIIYGVIMYKKYEV